MRISKFKVQNGLMQFLLRPPLYGSFLLSLNRNLTIRVITDRGNSLGIGNLPAGRFYSFDQPVYFNQGDL